MRSAAKTKFTSIPPKTQGVRDQSGMEKGKGRMDEATTRELKRKQLCFICKEPWEPGHRCMGKGKVQYIEVVYDNEEEDEVGHIQNIEARQPIEGNA
jgi:hypothetical protein